MFPAQIEEILKFVYGASSGYQVMIEAVNGRDVLELLFESELTSAERDACEREVAAVFKAKIGCTPKATAVPLGELPRSEKRRSVSSTAVTSPNCYRKGRLTNMLAKRPLR